MICAQFKRSQVDLGGTKVMENTDKALNGIVFFIQGLSFYVSDERWLLQDSGIKDVSLMAGESSQENAVEVLAIQRSRAGWRGV